MSDPGVDVDGQTVCVIYVAALSSEYDLELRELSRKQVLIVRRSTQCGRSSSSYLRRGRRRPMRSSPMTGVLEAAGGGALTRSEVIKVAVEAGGERQQQYNSSSSHKGGESAAARAETQPAKGPMCFNCRGRGHSARDCTVKL